MTGDVYVFPLSFGQQRLWFLDRFAPRSPLYVLSATVRLDGRLDLPALQRAAAEVVRRHEGLRTTFRIVDGEPRQVIAPDLEVPVRVVEVADQAQAERVAGEEGQLPFELERGPLARVTLLRHGDEWAVLVVHVHHIVADGWSLGVLMRELSALYGAFVRGEPSPLPDLPIQYADFAVWQREHLSGAALDELLAYWRAELDGLETLDLPTDRPRPAVRSSGGASCSFVLGQTVSARVEALSRDEQATPFMTLLAAFGALLARYSGLEAAAIGSPIAGRTSPETEDLVGFFVNMLVLRVDLSGDPTFRELVGRVRETALGAYAHQDLPFERLVEDLSPERDPTRNPLVDVVFQLQTGGAVAALNIERRTAAFDLTCGMWPAADGLRGELQYATDLFDEATAHRMAAHLTTLLAGAVADPEQRLSALALLTEDELDERRAWNATTAPVADDCVHDLVAARAARQPDALAVADGSERLTYGELDRRAERLAQRLRALGGGPDVLVAVALEPSVELVVALFATLKAGAAYVPLDLGAPPARLALILGDIRAPVLITNARGAQRLPAHDAVTVDVTEGGEPPDRDARSRARPQDLAYVIHTSGSTGAPKGVQVEHRGLANLAAWHVRTYGLAPEDRTTLLAAPSFDASVWELWPSLVAGSSIHVLTDPGGMTASELRSWLTAERITVAFLPTPLAEAVLDGRWPEPSSLRVMLTGGDVLRRVPARALPFALVNHYGPTEATVVATAGTVTVPPVGDGLPDIGGPIANMRAHVVDRRGRELPVGVPGELLLAGLGLARGYLHDDELTARRFTVDAGERRYRTGDRVRRRADGGLDFLGRLDRQVKVRGHRIELGEIEAVLTAHPGVRAATVALEGGPTAPRLVAYVVAPSTEPAALRRHVAQRLPAAMVPASIAYLDELPLTAHGKLDRQRLARLATSARARALPRTPLEAEVAELWRTVLGVEEVGVDDSFFDLGGHSLSATTLLSRVRDTFQVELPLRRMFQDATVAGIALAIVEARAAEVDDDELAALLADIDALGDSEAEALLPDRGTSAPERP